MRKWNLSGGKRKIVVGHVISGVDVVVVFFESTDTESLTGNFKALAETFRVSFPGTPLARRCRDVEEVEVAGRGRGSSPENGGPVESPIPDAVLVFFRLHHKVRNVVGGEKKVAIFRTEKKSLSIEQRVWLNYRVHCSSLKIITPILFKFQ